MLKIFLLVPALASSCSAMDYVRGFFSNEITIPSQEDYTQTFHYLHQNRDELNFENIRVSGEISVLNYSMPAFKLAVENPQDVIGKDLFMMVGDRCYQFKVADFNMSYDHWLLKQVRLHPEQAAAASAAGWAFSYLPSFLTTPLVTVAALAGVGYVGLKRGWIYFPQTEEPMPTSERLKELFYQQVGYGTTLAQLLQKNKDGFVGNFSLTGDKLTFEGTVEDGFWGLQKHIKLGLKPVAYKVE
ncbi:hypothetical protein [Candidatus Paracaedibacter symbiosus]|uniref:hypothetical protein n=1 Tax=Candidatus Paracaedibacter symbiosus TaxID=244582 RepID=UPI000509E3AA|nr:hypothetical protein [Candidatus Paracaedibacter symbiosus]